MLFNSYPFLLVFLPLTLVAFYGLRQFHCLNLSVVLLTLASIAFYSYWRAADTLVLLGSIIFNFLVSQGFSRFRKPLSLALLLLGVTVDLGVLAYFKYFNFLMTNVAAAGGFHYGPRDIVLPLGISFFTFTQLAYLVDCYRARISEPNLVNYGLFVTIFPHLIAGPIIHHAQMRPQFDVLRRFAVDPEMISMGLMIFIIGLSKKVLLADNLGFGADPIFNAADHGTASGFATAWAGVAAYTLQIYFDFSGYSDMAIGLALLFGLRLPINFNSPYKSRSIIEFWRRWHITLSTWLRDYLYIPLGGNRYGEKARLRNIFITMLLGGLWHGAGWTFIIWGGLHGTYIVTNHALLARTRRRPASDPKSSQAQFLVTCGKQSLTLLLVMVAWVFFRAKSVSGALLLLHAMAVGSGRNMHQTSVSPILYLWISLGALIALAAPNTQQLTRYTADLTEPVRLFAGSTRDALLSSTPALAATRAMAVVFGLLFAVSFAQLWRPTIFIYFNF